MRILSLAALAALLSVPALAQPTFHIKGGLNVATLAGDDSAALEGDDFESEPRLGGVAGAGVLLPLTPSVGLQVEALYSQKGEVFADRLGELDNETIRLDYVEIPAAIRFAVPTGSALEFGLSAGGYVGIPVQGEYEYETVAGGVTADLETRTDYGGLIGLDIGSGGVFAEARYTFGLTDAVEYDPSDDIFPDYRNQVASLTLGYRFGGGNRYRRY